MKRLIVFIIDGLPGGGAERIILTLARGLINLGHDVIVLSLDDRCDYPIPEGVIYIVSNDTGNRGLFRRINEIRRRALSLSLAFSEIEKKYGRPDLVLSNLHKTDRIVSKAKLSKKYNLWFWIHGVFSRSYLNGKSGISYLLKKIKIKSVYDDQKLVCVSNAVSDDMITNVGVKPSLLKTIYNPFDIDSLKKLSEEKNPYEGQNYVLHIGRFHEVKRHDRLLEAFCIADIPAKLIILGQGDSSTTLLIKNKIIDLGITDKVVLAGFIDTPLPIIRGAKMLILSSDSEGLPGVIIESLICGTPVVSTACPGGVMEIMSHELSAFTSQLNSEDLAEKIKLVWDSPYKIHRKMFEKFDSKLILNEYLSLINHNK